MKCEILYEPDFMPIGLPSCEGSGLKWFDDEDEVDARTSPLMRGEWIEISVSRRFRQSAASPLMRGEWIEITRL